MSAMKNKTRQLGQSSAEPLSRKLYGIVISLVCGSIFTILYQGKSIEIETRMDFSLAPPLQIIRLHNDSRETSIMTPNISFPMQLVESRHTLSTYLIESRKRARMLGRYTGPFDLVYLWANNTEEWSAAKNKIMEKVNMNPATWSPTRDNNELKLSMRSVEKYLPWIRNIYIMSNGQIPMWLDIDHPRIRVIDSDQLIDEVNGTTPNFNSHSLFLASAFIPDLSEIYLQMDDDFIIGQPLPENFFFWDYKHEVTSLIDWAPRNDLSSQLRLLKQIIPDYSPRWATHMPRCWNKTRVAELWRLHKPDIHRTVNQQLRNESDIDLTSFYGAFAKAYYNNPLFYFFGSQNAIYADKTLLYKAGKPLHFYGTIKNFLNKGYTSTNRPALVCLQDKGDVVGVDYFDKLSAAFNVGPSSFENKRALSDTTTQVFGHRGVGSPNTDELPIMENSMESIAAAEQAGLKWVEIDVGVTLDGIVIVGHFHETLYEDCPIAVQEKLVVSKTSYEVLCSQSKKLGFPVPPKLIDVLTTFKGKLGFQIELKQNTNYKLARLCNQATAEKQQKEECKERIYENDILLQELVAVLEHTDFPASNIIISSFEAPRLQHYKQLSWRYHGLKLVGGQTEGVDGMIKICQMFLGQNSSVSIPLPFATKQRVSDLQMAGISVEIGLPSAGHCLSMKPQIQMTGAVVKKQIAEALATNPDSICTDFPRDAIKQIHGE